MNDELTLVDWAEVETDGAARWKHDERDLMIDVEEYENVLRIALSRRIEAEGYETWLDTTVLKVRTIDEAEKAVETLADAVADGIGDVTAIGADVAEVGDEKFVHFHTVFDASLPDGIEPGDLLFEEEAGDDTVEATSAMELDEDDIEDEDGIRVEIYPVLIDDVTVHD